jgi:phage terminase large subunit-like protein
MWDLSCPDWEARIVAGRSLMPTLPLFRAEADLAVAFFDAIRLPDVPGTPLLRDAAGEWFREIVANLFGSRDPETNTRHIREVFNLVGKGNSKTTNGAALMMTALLMNTRPRAEYLLIGPTQAIADLAYRQAAGMVELDRELKKRFRIREHLKEIVDRVSGATLKVKTFDLNILTGPRPVGVLLDELHLLGKHHATGKVLRQIRGGLEKSTEGFLVMITTQSDEPPAGAFREELNMARAVRDGRYEGRMLPVLYELPDAIARDRTLWEQPTNWPMVMPNLGRSLRLDSLIHDWEQERVKGDAAIQIWASQHLNIEIGIGLKTDRWAGADYWQQSADPALSLDQLLERSEVVCCGVDGGGLDDLLALAVLGREHDTRRWLLWSHAWAHPSVFERRKGEAALLQDFVRQGDLTVVKGLPDDIGDLADIVQQVDRSGLLHAVGLDPFGVGGIVDALADRGIKGDDRVIGISQGWKISGAIKTAERKLSDGTLLHAGQPIVAWAVGNARVEPKGNAVTITKQVAGAGKIDPLMALFDAVALMATNPEAASSVIEQGYVLL